MAKAKKDAFVSYDHEDRKIAGRIKDDLISRNVDVWIDQEELRAGHPLIARIQEAIKLSAHFVLLWSKRASLSRWVNAEWNAAWHLEKNIIPCTLDKEPVPPFLRDTVRCTFAGKYQKGLEDLLAALKTKRKRRLKRGSAKSETSGYSLTMDIYTGQVRVLDNLTAGLLKDAKIEQKGLDRKVQKGIEEYPDDAGLLSLAAYHKKNAFQIKHWDTLQMRQYPHDKLLKESETLFYRSLAVQPDNPEAINGLGSILALRGDIDAAEFFVRRAIDQAELQGVDYTAAKDDLKMIRMLKSERTAGSKGGMLN